MSAAPDVRWRVAAGLGLAAVALAPPLAQWAESRMLTHMLVQIPALIVAGGALAAVAQEPWIRSWNERGVPGLLAASLTLVFWMTPIALDHAVVSAGWDVGKAVSLIVAGWIGWRSWRIAPTVVRAFFTGNFVWMAATVGVLFQDGGRRLCNAYLQDDQSLTGEAMVAVAVLLGVLLSASLAGRSSGTAASPNER